MGIVPTALVQTFGINATKRSGTLHGSCGENSIPDFWRPVGALKALQSEHWTQTKFDRPVILLDQIVIWHV
jgi:hypothetical protein